MRLGNELSALLLALGVGYSDMCQYAARLTHCRSFTIPQYHSSGP